MKIIDKITWALGIVLVAWSMIGLLFSVYGWSNNILSMDSEIVFGGLCFFGFLYGLYLINDYFSHYICENIKVMV